MNDAESRLLTLEMSVAHLQHDYDQLHEVALGLQSELRQLRQLLDKMTSRIDQLSTAPEVRSPELERPPHY